MLPLQHGKFHNSSVGNDKRANEDRNSISSVFRVSCLSGFGNSNGSSSGKHKSRGSKNSDSDDTNVLIHEDQEGAIIGESQTVYLSSYPVYFYRIRLEVTKTLL